MLRQREDPVLRHVFYVEPTTEDRRNSEWVYTGPLPEPKMEIPDYYWDYSGGLLVGHAAHIVDAIHWFMNSIAPLAVTCVGGHLNLPGSFAASARAHIRDSFECVRTRQEPNAPVEASLTTGIVLSMAMDSMRQGRRLKWNTQARKVEV